MIVNFIGSYNIIGWLVYGAQRHFQQ